MKKYGYMGGKNYTAPKYPKDWQARRKQVLTRCGERCEHTLTTGRRCPDKATDVNHRGHREDHSPESLEGLCRHHHLKYTSRQGNAAQKARKLKKPQPKHPGLK